MFNNIITVRRARVNSRHRRYVDHFPEVEQRHLGDKDLRIARIITWGLVLPGLCLYLCRCWVTRSKFLCSFKDSRFILVRTYSLRQMLMLVVACRLASICSITLLRSFLNFLWLSPGTPRELDDRGDKSRTDIIAVWCYGDTAETWSFQESYGETVTGKETGQFLMPPVIN